MAMFRSLLVAFLLIVLAFTSIAVATDGWTLVPIFFGDIAALNWRGQFNLDFLTYLILSGVWVGWRGGWSSGAVILGIIAATLGMIFMATYLLYLLHKTSGDMKHVLLGVHAR